MAAAIAERYPQLRCTTFDRPSAAHGALKTFTDHSIADRCDLVGGDFFNDDVPAGADTYLLSAILHDWDDQRCHQILANCRRAMSETGRLLVVDIVLSDERNVPDTYRNCLDLAVMLQLGGMERSDSEFRKLLSSAGFKPMRRTRIPRSGAM